MILCWCPVFVFWGVFSLLWTQIWSSKDYSGALALLSLYQPCFKLTLVLAWKTENVSFEHIKRNQMSQINCKILATLQWRKPAHQWKGEHSPNADWIEIWWDNQPAGGRKQMISSQRKWTRVRFGFSIVRLFEDLCNCDSRPGKSTQTWLVSSWCEMTSFCYMTSKILYYVHEIFNRVALAVFWLRLLVSSTMTTNSSIFIQSDII